MTAHDQHRATTPPSGSDTQVRKRMWTPWRMKYVGGSASEPGCIFCNRLAGDDDAASLILHRGERAFAIMNLYPYNTGHLMIVPNAHVASAEDADPADLAEIATLLRPISRALRLVLNPAGFNIGMNMGDVAGAGVAEHLHMHVVPRWHGDANFMPILASTMVMPELIPVTYAKVRAEIARGYLPPGATPSMPLIVLDETAEFLLVRRHANDAKLPTTEPYEAEAAWRSAARTLADLKIDASLIRWAGTGRIGEQTPAFTFVAAKPSTGKRADVAWVPVVEAVDALNKADAALVQSAVARHTSPVVALPG
ncbi:MAG: HIT family protein [Thermomicrobiales bacterium]